MLFVYGGLAVVALVFAVLTALTNSKVPLWWSVIFLCLSLLASFAPIGR
jgi:hypothetical protein